MLVILKDFLYSVDVNANLEYWIGLTRKSGTQTFSWSDGEQFNYADWMPNSDEPNNTGDCVRISKRDHWRDHPCSNVYSFVCKDTGGSIIIIY